MAALPPVDAVLDLREVLCINQRPSHELSTPAACDDPEDLANIVTKDSCPPSPQHPVGCRRHCDSNESEIMADYTSNSYRSCDTLDRIEAVGLSFYSEEDFETRSRPERFSLEETSTKAQKAVEDSQVRPFDRWLKHLHKKTIRRRTISTAPEDCDSRVLAFDGAADTVSSPTTAWYPAHHKSASSSSTGFIEGVRSASMTLASLSLAPRSRRTAITPRHLRGDRSARASHSGFRSSEDSCYLDRGPANDQAVTRRAIQRHRILEEIITTEEGYVADMRFLKSVST